MVYDEYSSCGEHYIGETAQALGKRLEEYQKQEQSVVKEHQSKAGHTIIWEGVKIINQETVDIRCQRSAINRDGGYNLPPIYNHLLSRDQIRSHDTSSNTSNITCFIC